MPVGINGKPIKNGNSSSGPSEVNGAGHCGTGWGGMRHDHFGKKIMMTLMGVLLVYLVFYVGVLTRNSIKKFDYIGTADQTERMITVNGYGKVNGANDIAVTTIGYSNVDADVAKAQAANKKVMDALMTELKKMGVSEKDMQTNYTIYPEYNYTQDKGQQLKGYRVSNNVTIKIRDLTKIPAVLSLPGKYGATEVSGLSFTIDDPDNLKVAARDKALTDAGMKAKTLARQLGVRLVEVVAYNEYEGGPEYPGPYPMLKMDAMGGGPMMNAPEAVATGSKDVVMNVNITYKIAPKYYAY
ncbi:MAG: DUF541 domain-containing protein [Candidatus Magasanikbacteria bacterium]|nr:DUF541 domain-containing protein [Candidatus Magasanikbacteria bacterium]